MKAKEIRKKFVQYFESKGHQKIPSSGLIPLNDNTLLFNNAGMNQFKDIFTGKSIPTSKRAVSIQKCVRAGGKHNDLENVGLTARHHTFFEMLGNFSFGDYFKPEAIQFAWEFLTKDLKIPANKLYVTVHHSDDEAYNIWTKNIGLDSSRVFKKGDKDNFWEMGEFGPCGPCSEIFFDHGPSHSTPGLKIDPNGDILDDEARYIEIWNLVFMQYEKTPQGTIDLPNPSIDTGAGLERLAAVLQGVYWNYDTDLFMPIIQKLEQLSNKSYQDQKYCSQMRIVADHIRSATMLITDGVIPANEGRGYVLRRIIRRAVKNLKDLSMPQDVLKDLVDITFSILSDEYSQNFANIDLAKKFLSLEEIKFYETLDNGLKYLTKSIKSDVTNNILSGEAAFKLYDTFGFPPDLTQIILSEKGLSLDQDQFESLMKNQKEESKKSWKGNFNLDDKVFFDLKEKYGPTRFFGYDSLSSKSKLLDIIDIGDKKGLLFDATPFYGESGGQAGDIGTIVSDGKTLATINNTQKPIEQLFIHIADRADDLSIGSTYQLIVDSNNRELTMRNHSATHLLQAALIKVLGNHVKQAGSSVNAEKLRFDFTHTASLTMQEIEEVEKIVNDQIQNALDVTANEMSMEDAIKDGALAFFGEKYGESVRVLKMSDFSIELCGGTHVNNTKDIGLFSINSESSLSTGVRRIEAITSTTAIEMLQSRSKTLTMIEHLLKTKGLSNVEKISNLLTEIKDKSKEIKNLKDKIEGSDSRELFNSPEKINNDYLFKSVEVKSESDLKKISDHFVEKYNNGILVLHSSSKDRVQVLIRGPKSLKSVNLSDILKNNLNIINGRGGGKPFMAQGSGEIQHKDQFINNLRESIFTSIDGKSNS